MGIGMSDNLDIIEHELFIKYVRINLPYNGLSYLFFKQGLHCCFPYIPTYAPNISPYKYSYDIIFYSIKVSAKTNFSN